MLRRGGGRSGGRPFRPELTFDLRGSCRHRDDGQDRLPRAQARVRLPELGDLRRPRLGVRLRALRRPLEGERAGPLARGDGAGARGHRRARLVDHPPPPRLGGLRARRGLHRPARRLPDLQAALPGRPARAGAVREAAEQETRRDLRLRPDRGAALQPDVQDARRRRRGDRLGRVPPPGDGAGDLHQLQERRAARAPQAAVRDRPGRQVVSQRDHARQLHLPHARVRADGDGVLRAARLEPTSGTATGSTSATRGTCATASARATCAFARTTPTSSRTTRARRATSSTSSRSAGPSSRESRTAATSTCDSTPSIGDEARVGRRRHRRALRPVRDRARARPQPLHAHVPDRRVRRGDRGRATSGPSFASTPRSRR